MILIAGRTGNSKALSSPVPVRVKIHGHHPNEHKMGNETTPKLILLPNSVEDLFSVAGTTNWPYSTCTHASKIISEVSWLNDINNRK